LVTRRGGLRVAPPTGAEQLALPLLVAGDPTQPAGWVAALLGLPVESVHAAIAAGDLPATFDGTDWQVPMWAVAPFGRSVG